MRHARWWLFSGLASALLIIVLVGQWRSMNNYEAETRGLFNEVEIEEYLSNWQKEAQQELGVIEPMQTVRTGLFIQSLKFFNSTELSVSGYIWQRYAANQRHIRPGKNEVGFVLPEQVNSGGDINAREMYRMVEGTDEVIVWFFEATLRQPFVYKKYPFDHKTVWIRLWHREFWRNIALVPDFKAYYDFDETGEYERNCRTKPSLERDLDAKCTFGIDENIVLGTWERQKTYLDYTTFDKPPPSYDTNFGISSYIGRHPFPELRYNFVLKRNFENAFILYLLPLLLVAMLLFAALLTVSDRDELSSRFGFNTSGFIGACSALFFVVLLAHIQLREQFAGSGIVYIEYFYILMYILLVLSTTNVYLFSVRPRRGCGWILYEDNIIFKVAFWPVVLACLTLITLGHM